MNDRYTLRLALSLAGGLLSMLSAGAAEAVDCTFSCSPPTSCSCVDSDATEPCTISTAYALVPGTVVDCTGHDIVFQDEISVTDGVLTVRADDVTVLASHNLRAFRTSSGAPFGLVLDLSGSLNVYGSLDARSDLGGGTVRVVAGTDIVLDGISFGINVNGTAPSAAGGHVTLAAGRDVRVEKDLLADGAASNAAGGRIIVQAGRNLLVRAMISAGGWDDTGGIIRLIAEEGVVDENTGVVQTVRADGHGQTADGGEVSMTGKQVLVGALVSARGGIPYGGEARGGEIHLEGGSLGVAINADLDARGGASQGQDAGAIKVDSAGPIVVGNGVTILARSDANGGDGGDISMVSSESTLIVHDATIDARGDWSSSSQGTGATVELEACDLVINSGATIDARGYNAGTILLTGREALTVSSGSNVDATSMGGEAGAIALDYRLSGRCTSSPAVGCEADHCSPLGVCSNNASLQCSTNQNCTIGCNTGTCQKHCVDIPSMSCTSDANCTGCVSGSCQPNPNTGGTTVQFHPGPPQLEQRRTLNPCS